MNGRAHGANHYLEVCRACRIYALAIPHPITHRPADVCEAYINGNNPVSHKPILEEIVAGLSDKLAAADMKPGFIEREKRHRLLKADTPSNIEKMFHNNMWTDGMPIVLPTEERVAAMLKDTSHKPDEVVGVMRPSPPHEAWEYTVEMVAVKAVMAGARPEYLPAILAIASTGVSSLFSSTSSFARMVVINGPVRNEIGMNTAIGALGPWTSGGRRQSNRAACRRSLRRVHIEQTALSHDEIKSALISGRIN